MPQDVILIHVNEELLLLGSIFNYRNEFSRGFLGKSKGVWMFKELHQEIQEHICYLLRNSSKSFVKV